MSKGAEMDTDEYSASDQTLPPAHPFAAHQHQLRERLLALLAPLAPPLQADVKTALAGESKLLSDAEEAELPSGVWSLLTLLLSHYLAPDIDLLVASGVALSLECYVCAIDLLDDVMDEDQTPTLLDLGIPLRSQHLTRCGLSPLNLCSLFNHEAHLSFSPYLKRSRSHRWQSRLDKLMTCSPNTAPPKQCPLRCALLLHAQKQDESCNLPVAWRRACACLGRAVPEAFGDGRVPGDRAST